MGCGGARRGRRFAGGGRFADHNAARTLIVATIGAAGALAALHLLGTIPFLVGMILLAWGMFAFVSAPSLQYRVVSLAGPGGQLAQSLPASAINLGIAFGSFAGGAALESFTSSAAVSTGLIIAVIAIPVAWATSYLTPPDLNPATRTAPTGAARDQQAPARTVSPAHRQRSTAISTSNGR